jgi:glycyl-tRNA synthetase beta chain
VPEQRVEFLLEVGFEEVPAPWLDKLASDLKDNFVQRAKDLRLAAPEAPPSGTTVFWTPRRLVLRSDVLSKQRAESSLVYGPSRKAALDAQGQWTKAALGFAAKHGVRPEDLAWATKKGDEQQLMYSKPLPEEPAAAVLPTLIARVLRDLAFPKRMNWDAWLDDGRGAFPFGRPIRWVVALLGGEIVPFTVYEQAAGAKGAPIVQSGDTTRGHRFLPRGASAALPVRGHDDLRETLRRHFVLLDPAEREAAIREGLRQAAGRDVRDDHGLVNEWRDLVEFPTVVTGRIPREFEGLPADVLRTVLVHHQKYIPLELPGGAGFAAVINRDAAGAAEIVRGMERVVVARLRDAAFFFEEDRKRPLASRVDDLAGVGFHRGLGTYRDKAERLVRLVDAMGASLGLLTKPEHEAAREAARLAKADLTTLMVREFTELQGVMGGIYLAAEGTQWESVARAVRWHYHPVSVEPGSAPANELAGFDATVFAAVSLADKLDTLAGYFGLGQIPTGSSDPFGLRRAAQGVVRVLLDFWKADRAERRPSLRTLVAAAVAGHGENLKRPADETRKDLEAFLFDRLRSVFAARGYPDDEIEAAVGAREPDALDDPHEAWLRLEALHKVRSEARDDFEHLAVAFKRAKNILGGGPPARVDPGLLEEPAERALHDAVKGLAAGNGGYEGRLRALASLRAPVDSFFDHVLVMAEDPKLRSNRLSLLAETLAPFYRIADISKLGG